MAFRTSASHRYAPRSILSASRRSLRMFCTRHPTLMVKSMASFSRYSKHLPTCKGRAQPDHRNLQLLMTEMIHELDADAVRHLTHEQIENCPKEQHSYCFLYNLGSIQECDL